MFRMCSSRLNVIGALLLLLVCGAVSAETLRAAGTKHGIFVGAAANAGVLHSGETLYNGTLNSQYSLVTAENSCKWGPTEPSQGKFDYSGCDDILANARLTNQTFRGHNLCWGNYNPDWLEKLPANELQGALQNHISNVVRRYGTSAYSWDVVNEAIDDHGTILFKNTTWYPALPNYVDVAFQAAAEARGDSKFPKLFYNDYSVASSTGFSQGKSDKMFHLVQSMQQRKIPIDGVGLQMHLQNDYDLVDGVKTNMQRYNGIGIEVHITELDISCPKCIEGSSAQQDQASLYASLLKACLDAPNCKSFETWGFTDKHTWKGANNHPLPFDENYAPKIIVQALLDTMNGNNTWVDMYYRRVESQSEPSAIYDKYSQ